MAITANDEPTEIEADVDKRFSSIIVDLPVQQTGTGTPSPSNPRPFTMWTDVSLYVSDTEEADEPTLSIELPTPLYGGKIDMVRGEIATTYNSKESGTGWEMTQEGQFRCQVSAYNNGDETSTDVADLYAVHYETVSNKDAYDATDDFTCGLATIAGTTYLYVNDAQYNTLESFITHIADEVFVFRAHIPMSDVTEPHIVYLPEGTSYVWADAGFVDYTVSGTPPLSLPNSLGKPLKAWSVEVSPYQEGSGDPSPDNVRPIHGTDKLTITTAGKNLFTKDFIGELYLPLPQGTHITASCSSVGTNNTVYYLDENKQQIDYWTLNTDVPNEDRKYRSFVLVQDAYYWRFANNNRDCQIEIGDTPTPFTPYIAPSQTVIDVPPLSANKWDEETQIGYYNSNGEYLPASGQLCTKNMIAVNPSTTYRFIAGNYSEGTNIGTAVCFYKSDRQFIERVLCNVGTFTTPSDCAYINVNIGQAYGATYNNDVAINYPSTVTTYNPYNATVYTGTIGSEGGESGTRYEDIKANVNSYYMIGGLNGPYCFRALSQDERCILTASQLALAKQQELFTHGSINNPYQFAIDCAWVYNDTVRVSAFGFDNITDWKNYINEQSEIGITYPLATPQTLTLSAPTIPTPQGTATTWATAEDGTVDSMEVTYVGKAT